MIRNRYLDDLGIKPKDYSTNFISAKDPRRRKWKKQRKQYSFDERETWNMDHIFAEWLYSHVKMFDEKNNIDTSFSKFIINGKEKTLQECIDYILRACEYYLKLKPWSKYEAQGIRTLQKAARVWAEILPAMWW